MLGLGMWLLLFVWRPVASQDCDGVADGDQIQFAGFVFNCTQEGALAAACLDGESVVGPGESVVDGSFEFRCRLLPTGEIDFEIVACVTPSGAKIDLGASLRAEGGLYECEVDPDTGGDILNFTPAEACFIDGAEFKEGETGTLDGTPVVCAVDQDGFYVWQEAVLIPTPLQDDDLGALIGEAVGTLTLPPDNEEPPQPTPSAPPDAQPTTAIFIGAGPVGCEACTELERCEGDVCLCVAGYARRLSDDACVLLDTCPCFDP